MLGALDELFNNADLDFLESELEDSISDLEDYDPQDGLDRMNENPCKKN